MNVNTKNPTSSGSSGSDAPQASYSTAIKGFQEYNSKLLEFTQTNTKTSYEFFQRLVGGQNAFGSFGAFHGTSTKTVRDSE